MSQSRTHAGSVVVKCRFICFFVIGACGLGKDDERCATAGCPVGTGLEEVRSLRAGERDVSDGSDPPVGISGGRGVAFFEDEVCAWTCSAISECPSGTWPVITEDCFTCAILDDLGQVLDSECSLGGDGSERDSGTSSGTTDTGDDLPQRPGWEQVTAGDTHTCARHTDGTVTCWGDSDGPPTGGYEAVDAGSHATCALTTGGQVVCWGTTGPQRGSASETALLTGAPTGRYAAISVGDRSACVLDTAGALTCWGTEAISLPGPFQAVSVGGDHACVLSTLGRLECFGDDSEGQVRATPDGEFIAISAGAVHSCALASDADRLECWAINDAGESSPPAETWQMVSVGARFACGITDTDRIRCWGAGAEGQLEAPDVRAVQVSAGTRHGCAALWDGSLACWGADERGQATTP
ncbi:MAG TPA: hypothetical protein DFR83_22625 [Deltaproteobacteria bacterium]|nr:hypothetical protein [Deltaproteobacteria bacterium]